MKTSLLVQRCVPRVDDAARVEDVAEAIEAQRRSEGKGACVEGSGEVERGVAAADEEDELKRDGEIHQR